MPPTTHTHDFHEMGRVFPYLPEHQDVEMLSPHGGHVIGSTGESELAPATHPDLVGKVPAVKPHVILQCQDDEGCPDGPKHIVHVNLHKDEWEPIRDAILDGRLDPDGNGTNRLMSTLSLSALGLERIEAMLGPGRRSGAQETVIGV